jgi:hypothetical protein
MAPQLWQANLDAVAAVCEKVSLSPQRLSFWPLRGRHRPGLIKQKRESSFRIVRFAAVFILGDLCLAGSMDRRYSAFY